jgi:hypothetical protein
MGKTKVQKELKKRVQTPLISPLRVSKKNIENFRKRKISQVAKDLEQLTGTDPRVTAKVLMARGVPKLFNMRKDLMKIQEHLKLSITDFQCVLSGKNIDIDGATLFKPSKKNTDINTKEYYRILGMVEGFQVCAKFINIILNKTSWQMPDGDEEFEKLLRVSAIELEG